ncbi:sugar ABC transporter ATP-binding protein [Acidobacteriota bacterium]
MEGICKNFGTTQALKDVNFELREGEVHALIGENGAGKSTLVKILSGALHQDAGQIILEGKKFFPATPLESRKSGISMIYQELNLAPHLTVEENIMLGKEKISGPFLKKKEMKKETQRALEMVNHSEIPLDTPIKELSVGIKQIVEIARALVDKAKILIMDEPTSSLSLEDSDRLFQIIHNLKELGVSIIYISHFLEEVQKVADRFTVLRDGKNIESGDIQDVTHEKIIQLMIGRKLDEMFPKTIHKISNVILSLKELQGKKMSSGINLQLHKGEILGFAGLVGAGRTDVLRTIYGLDPVIRGNIKVGYISSPKSNPWSRIKQGMGYLSEDRQKEGLALSLSIAENIALSHFSPYRSRGLLNLKKYKKGIENFLQTLNIKTSDSNQPVLSLSGGNQQKVALARLLHQKADILLLDEPTRGIDVLSKTQIYEWIGELAVLGKAVIFVSSYLPELLGVCDNIAVFHRGKLIALHPTDQWDAHSIMTAATLGTVTEGKFSELCNHA